MINDEPFTYDTLEFRDKLLFNDPPPDCLYHYTTAAGLLGIVQSNDENNIFKMWASDSRYLNDSLEYIGGLKVAEECLKSSRYASSSLIKKAAEIISEKNGEVVMLSLSSKGNLLSQWRAYSENGGYSIQFNTESFKARPGYTNDYLAQCIYSTEVLSAKMEECIEWHQDKFEKYTNDHLDNCLRGLVGTIRALATLFKHESFSEESEWRYVVTYPVRNKIETRNSNGLLVPYICLDFPEKSITKVCVAPGSKQSLAQYSAIVLLENNFKESTPNVELSGSSFTW